MAFAWNKDKTIFNNCHLIPSSTRIIISGSSGSGKTNLLFKLLLDKCPICKKDYLDYEKLYLYSASADQNEYQILSHSIKKGLHKELIMNLFNEQNQIDNYKERIDQLSQELRRNNIAKSKIEIFSYLSAAELPKPESMDKKKKNLIIFDDCAFNNNDQPNLKLFYIRGRHNSCNSIYLTQDYYQLDKKSIRNNSNFQIFFKQKPRDIQSIYSSLVADMNYDIFKNNCIRAWGTKYNFISIDVEEHDINKKYIINFKEPLFQLNTMGSNYKDMIKLANSHESFDQKVKDHFNNTKSFYIAKEKEYEPLSKKVEEVSKNIKDQSKDIPIVKKPDILLDAYPENGTVEERKSYLYRAIDKGSDPIFGLTYFTQEAITKLSYNGSVGLKFACAQAFDFYGFF